MKTMQKLMLLLITLSMVVGMLTVPVAAATTVEDWGVLYGPYEFEGNTTGLSKSKGVESFASFTDPIDSTKYAKAVVMSETSDAIRLTTAEKLTFPATGEKKYKISAKLKLETGTATINFNPSISTSGYTLTNQCQTGSGAISSGKNRTVTDQWETYTWYVTIANNGGAGTTGAFYFGGMDKGSTIYVDDVVIYELKTVTKYDVTVSANDGGSVTLDGEPVASKAVTEGGNVVVAVAPDAGYEVDTVTVNGAAVKLTDNTYTIENIAADTAIAVSFKVKEVTQSTVTVVAGANGSVLIDGEAIAEKTVEDGTEVVLTVTPDQGYEAAVTVNGEVAALVGDTLTLTVDEDMAVAVSFNLPKEWVAIDGPYTFDTEIEGLTVAGTMQSATIEDGAIKAVASAASRLTFKSTQSMVTGKLYKFTAKMKAAAGTTVAPGLAMSTARGSDLVGFATNVGETFLDPANVTFADKTSNYPSQTMTAVGDTWNTYSWYVRVSSGVNDSKGFYLSIPENSTLYVDDVTVSEWKTPTYYDVTVSSNEFGSVLYNGEAAPATISAKEASNVALELVPASDKYQVDTVTVNGTKVDVENNILNLNTIKEAKNVVVTFSRLKYWKEVVSYDGADYENWYYENSEDDTHTKHPFSAVDVVNEGDNQVLIYESPYSTMRVGELDLFKFESGKKYKVSFKVKFDTEEDAFDLTMMSNSRMFMLYDKYGMIGDEIAVAKVVDRDKYDDGEFINVAFKDLTPGEWATYSFVIDATSVNPAGSYGGKEYTDETEFFIRSSVEGTFYVDGFSFCVEEDVPDEPVVEYVDVTVNAGANGSVKINGEETNSATVEKGSNVEFEFIPATGYEVATVIVDGVEYPADTTLSLTFDADATVEVTFDEIVKVPSISTATVIPDADYAEGYSILAYFKALVPVSKTLKEMGANFTIGEDTFKLKAEAYTTDYQFGIRVFGDDFDADTECAFEGYIEVE